MNTPLDCKHYSSNIYFKHTSHTLPVAGLGVGDAALFVVGVVVHGVTLAIKKQIKNEINRQNLEKPVCQGGALANLSTMLVGKPPGI